MSGQIHGRIRWADAKDRRQFKKANPTNDGYES